MNSLWQIPLALVVGGIGIYLWSEDEHMRKLWKNLRQEVLGTMPLSVDICEVDGVTIMTLAGALVVETHQSFTDDMKQLLTKGKKTILLNLEGVKSIDDEGIARLFWAHLKVHEVAGSLKLLRPGRCVQKFFAQGRIIGYPTLESFFEVHQNYAEAVASFKDQKEIK